MTRSRGIGDVVTRLLKADSVEDIAGFVGSLDDQQISLKGWHPDSDVGGGTLYWDSAALKSTHNGGTIFSPTVPWTTTTADYLNAVGETDGAGTGVWVRVGAKFQMPAENFGASSSISDNGPSINKILESFDCILPPFEIQSQTEILIQGEDDPVSTQRSKNLVGSGTNSRLILDGCRILVNDGTYYSFENFTVKRIGVAGEAIRIGVDGVQTLGNRRISMTNIRVDGSTGDGIIIQEGWICSIYNPIIQRCTLTGVSIITGSLYGASWNGINFFGGEIQGNATGVFVEGVKGLNFVGTAIEGNSQHGLHLKGTNRDVNILSYFEANGLTSDAYHDLFIEDNDTNNGTPYNITIQGGTGFLRGTSGTEVPVRIEKGIHTIFEDGVSFFGYAANTNKMIQINENVSATVKGYIGKIRTDCPLSQMAEVLAQYFGYDFFIRAVETFTATDATLTESIIGFTAPNFYGEYGDITFFYDSPAIGNIVFRLTFVDADTGLTIGSIASYTAAAVIGTNSFNSFINLGSRDISSKNIILKIGRDGASGSDTLVGSIDIYTSEVLIRKNIELN